MLFPRPLRGDTAPKGLLLINVMKKCLVNAPSDAQYVALSYCWGVRGNLKHTQSNSTWLRTENSLTEDIIPATIYDAMSLVKAVGLKYLWVDALCIPQDNPMDQIQQMDLIYSQADFTIVAASGSDAHVGLPGIRSGSRGIRQRLLKLSTKTIINAIDSPQYPGIRGSVWAQRAWTLQERLLSRKKLFFTEKQVYWHCQKATWLEEFVLEGVSNQEFQRRQGGGPDDISLMPFCGYKEYSSIAAAYSSRKMTCWTDIQVAFAGIIRAISNQQCFQTGFVWGLPAGRFFWSLSWEMDSSAKQKSLVTVALTNGATCSLACPSWSWMGWMGDHCQSSAVGFERGQENLQLRSEITFYVESTTGQLLKIDHLISRPGRVEIPAEWNNSNEYAISTTRKKWAGSPKEIAGIVDHPKPFDMALSSRLHFWSSVARLAIYRLTSEDGSICFLTIGSTNSVIKYRIRITVTMASALDWRPCISGWPDTRRPIAQTEHEPWFCERRPKWEDQSRFMRIKGKREVADSDFVVIGRSVERPGSYLTTLIIQPQKDVSFRIGCAWISEEDWINIKNRAWKRVLII